LGGTLRDEIENLLAADPFLPFEITMASGQKYIVQNPGLAILGGDIIYLMNRDPDTHSVLRLVQISSLDTIV
jgi:hypothetical protein